MPNIAIIWDFDGTLTPEDSTTITVETIEPDQIGSEFWSVIKDLRGDKKQKEWKHILAMDAPIWTYSLSRLASKKRIPLNKEFFQKFVLPKIELFPKVNDFLKQIKKLQSQNNFRRSKIKIHHFIVSAGLKDLIELVFPDGLITFTYGCRYTIVAHPDHTDEPESIPVFCMDETAKTRAVFEISKGSFKDQKQHVNSMVKDKWAEFSDMIYIGDGDTDIPALSLIRERGGLGIVVYDKDKKPAELKKKLANIKSGKRADLLTPADFSLEGELFQFISARCHQIRQRYEASAQ